MFNHICMLIFTFFSGCLTCSSTMSFLLWAAVGALYFSLNMSPSSSSSSKRSIAFLGLGFWCPAERDRKTNQTQQFQGKDPTWTWIVALKSPLSHTYQSLTYSGLYHWRSHPHHHHQTAHLLLHQHQMLYGPVWRQLEFHSPCSPLKPSHSLKWTGCYLWKEQRRRSFGLVKDDEADKVVILAVTQVNATTWEYWNATRWNLLSRFARFLDRK